VPYDEAVERIKSGYYGEAIRKDFQACEELNDSDGLKRIMFLVGRKFDFEWSKEYRTAKAEDMIFGLCGASEDSVEAMWRRFDFILVDYNRDLVDHTISTNKTRRESHTDADVTYEKSYEQLFGEQVEAVCLYVRHKGAFGFTSDEEMEKLVYFFRFQLSGTCNLSPVCILASYLG